MSYSTLRDMPIRMRRCRKRKSPLIRLAPRSVFVEERERLIDEVTIKLLAHVVLDVARHADQNAALQKKKKPADQTCTEIGVRGRTRAADRRGDDKTPGACRTRRCATCRSECGVAEKEKAR